MKKQFLYSLLLFLGLVGCGTLYRIAIASDHDDGVSDTKSQALNLTDHFVFKEGAASGNLADNSNLVFIQNSNPRSLPGQQYFFSVNGRYEMHVTRVATKSATPTGSDDMSFQFNFGVADANNNQSILFTVVSAGNVVGTGSGTTTNIANSKTGGASLTMNSVNVGGQPYTFFAGHREDTFYFDVERFFQVRAFLLGTFILNTNPTLAPDCTNNVLGTGAPAAIHLFNPSSCAPDFTKNYNVNSIVLRAPIAALQANAETTFDTWSAISTQQ